MENKIEHSRRKDDLGGAADNKDELRYLGGTGNGGQDPSVAPSPNAHIVLNSSSNAEASAAISTAPDGCVGGEGSTEEEASSSRHLDHYTHKGIAEDENRNLRRVSNYRNVPSKHYRLPYECRSIFSVGGSTSSSFSPSSSSFNSSFNFSSSSLSDSHFFIAGTSSPVHPNQIHLIEYLDSTCDIGNVFILPHDDEITFLNAIGFVYMKEKDANSSLKVLTASRSYQNFSFEERCRYFCYSFENSENCRVETQFDFSSVNPFYKIKRVLCDPYKEERILIVDTKGFELFYYEQPNNPNEAASRSNESKMCRAAAFDPHHSELVGAVEGSALIGWDFRSNKYAYKRNNTNGVQIYDIDFNANYPYCISTAEENGNVHFYDLRNLHRTLHTIVGAHTHWVTSCRFNTFHDQLVVTAGTDGAVKLWNVNLFDNHLTRIKNPTDAEEEEKRKEAKDSEKERLVKLYDDHEDTVYGLAWSVTDAWCFASVSNSSKLVIHTVPSQEKYKILL